MVKLSTKSDKMFMFIVNVTVVIITLIVLYPLVYVLSSSFSSPKAVVGGKVVLFPVEPTLRGYQEVFSDKNIISGFFNSVFYTVSGTILSVSMTMIAAYSLSQKKLPFNNVLMFLFTFTMLFSGGMIPSYLLVSSLRLLNTPWAIILPGCISAYNLIITRTFLQNIPEALREAANIDGCSDIKYFISIIIPLSSAIIAVLCLFYAVGLWSNYFSAFLYLTNRRLFPLQVVLREILLKNQIAANSMLDSESLTHLSGMEELLKYSLIVVTSVPMLLLYPFIQKHFLEGVMIGSLKG
ncbi:MAG TPA: carbohydrate ABC transporter permease [Clostridiales bacterium]|nr:carbohydrate ABC transporter permease [Clostridiales bacterium]